MRTGHLGLGRSAQGQGGLTGQGKAPVPGRRRVWDRQYELLLYGAVNRVHSQGCINTLKMEFASGKNLEKFTTERMARGLCVLWVDA